MFKDFVINNANPKSSMVIDIWGEIFTIECNRYRNVGEKTKAYKIWDSIDQRYNVVLHTDTKRVPDLDRFRSYFQTLLVHHLDSRVMDNVMQKVMEKYNWGIPIHDAAIVSPAAVADVRKWYAEELEAIYKDRKQILKGFFKSIGITSAAAQQWETLQKRVVPYIGDFKVSDMALK